MSYLSSNQLKQYKDEGFVSPINIFSKEKAKEVRNEIEFIENHEDPPFNTTIIKPSHRILKKGSLLKWIEMFN